MKRTVSLAILLCAAAAFAQQPVHRAPNGLCSPPSLPVITGPNPACAGVAASLQASSTLATSYQWYMNGSLLPGETSALLVAGVEATYTVTATNACLTTAQSAPYVLTFQPLPATPSILEASGSFCSGSHLTSSAASGNQWYLDGSPIGGATNATVTLSSSGAYAVTTSANGCESARSTAVNVTIVATPPAPAINPIGSTTFCAGGSVMLSSNNESPNQQWSLDGNPIGGATGSVYIAVLNGSYTVAVTSGGCTSAPSAPVTVTVNPSPPTPAITPGGPTAFCAGGSVTLTSSSASGNQWYLNGSPIGGATSDTYVATASGGYTLVVTTSGCSSASSASTSVTAAAPPPTPAIAPAGATTFCAGSSVTLTSDSATGNQWYLDGAPIGGATSDTYPASAPGNYTVVVTINGCSSAASSPVAVTATPPPPTPGITPLGPTTFCTGGTVTLSSSSASGNQWSVNGNPIGGATQQTFIASNAGSYTVVVVGATCTSAPSAATVVSVNAIPATPTITTPGPTTFCSGGSAQLSSSSGSGNQWFLNGNPIGGATNQTYNATATGNYTVIATISGCSSAASAATSITVNPPPSTPTITPLGPTTFCAGSGITLLSSSVSGNQWRLNGSPIGGATGQTLQASTAGDYTVAVTSAGCTSTSATTTLTSNPNPNATITAGATAVSGSTGNTASVVSAGAGATYAWTITGGTITGGTGTNAITFTAGAAGTLSLQVTVTTGSGCVDLKSANVTVTAAVPGVTVVSVTPNNGPLFGGQAVTIAGTGFLAGATVTFGGTAASNVVVVSSTSITAKTPAHAVGSVNVTVTNTNTNSGTRNAGYTFNAQQFDPNGDGVVDASDVFYLVNYLFQHGPLPGGALSGDANGDGIVDPADIFYAINYIFLGGPHPLSLPGHGAASPSADARIAGSLTLGTPTMRESRYVIPVILTPDAATEIPQAMSLRVRFSGNVADTTIHRAGASAPLQPMFEISRFHDDALVYLIVFNANDALTVGRSGSAVIAEIEVDSDRAAMDISIDAGLTMLSNRNGTASATVINGRLRVKGTRIVPDESAPRMPRKD